MHHKLFSTGSELVEIARHGVKFGEYIQEHQEELFGTIPELRPMVGFDQLHKCHVSTVWNHTLLALWNLVDKLSDARELYDIVSEDVAFLKTINTQNRAGRLYFFYV